MELNMAVRVGKDSYSPWNASSPSFRHNRFERNRNLWDWRLIRESEFEKVMQSLQTSIERLVNGQELPFFATPQVTSACRFKRRCFAERLRRVGRFETLLRQEMRES